MSSLFNVNSNKKIHFSSVELKIMLRLPIFYNFPVKGEMHFTVI